MIIAIIQARLASTRLPNKVLLEVVPGISMVEMVARKVQLARLVDKVVVTTPDQEIFELMLNLLSVDCTVWTGERNVLSEFMAATDYTDRATYVRITADCPLIRPEIIDKCVQEFLDRDVYLVYNSFEDTGADGSDVEVFSMSALEKAHKNATEREHPTVWMRENLRTHYVETPFEGCSVDTLEDLQMVRKIFREGEC